MNRARTMAVAPVIGMRPSHLQSSSVLSRVRDPGRGVDHASTWASPRIAADFDLARMSIRSMHETTHAGTATRSSVTSRDEDVETETQALAPGPTVPTSSNHCALISATFSSIPSGTVAATISGGRLQGPFVMRATFDTAIPCTCANGEYRQYVRGSFTAGGRTVTHMLGPGRPLDPSTFQEDGDVAAGTDVLAQEGQRSAVRPGLAVPLEPGERPRHGTLVAVPVFVGHSRPLFLLHASLRI